MPRPTVVVDRVSAFGSDSSGFWGGESQRMNSMPVELVFLGRLRLQPMVQWCTFGRLLVGLFRLFAKGTAHFRGQQSGNCTHDLLGLATRVGTLVGIAVQADWFSETNGDGGASPAYDVAK